MTTVYLLSLLLLVPGVAGGSTSKDNAIEVRVDPRVELMSIVFRLAGNPEYNTFLSHFGSPYAAAVEKHFGSFKEHPVVKAAQDLRARRGVSYDAVMSMAVHIEDTIGLKERVPFDTPPPNLDGRWRPREACEFLEKARRFVEDTDFPAFLNQHQQLYQETSRRMKQALADQVTLDWFDSYFGPRPAAKFFLVPGMLTGGGSYGARIRFDDGREEIFAVIGVCSWDQKGIPIFPGGNRLTVVHELCHSYVNPFVDRHLAEFEKAARKLYATCEKAMKKQAYGSWQTMMREYMVRACEVRYRLASDGEEAAEGVVKQNRRWGFKWIGELSEFLEEYESNRGRYPTMHSFMPQIVSLFNALSESSDVSD